MEPRGRFGASWAPLGRQVAPGTQNLVRGTSSFSLFVRKWINFGPIWDPSWGAMGRKNHHFVYKIVIK